ncbi:MAG TPA: DNA-directed RNA polymerase subunit omega [Vicinamibacterales bacterium]|nr:DNA-directed RNA polymerase subunit omega [Vicinamibacterales bacterium]
MPTVRVEEAAVDGAPEASAGTTQPSTAPAPAVTSSFLFVNIAAQRAKQLRRGARPRIDPEQLQRLASQRPERVAMEEVRRGLVHWELPPFKGQDGR